MTQAAVTNIQELDMGKCCDILEQSSVLETRDLGSVIIHLVLHPTRGSMFIVNSACGKSAALQR